MTTLIPLDRILPNPKQPRTAFDPAELEGLAQSIREHGVIQPIVVEEAANGYYILHDGERRLRASKLAQQKDIPASVVPPMNGGGDQARLERALVANLQRADLNPIEEARAFEELRKCGLTVGGVARKLGVHPARVEQRLKLLELDAEIQELVAAGRLSKDIHVAQALLGIADKSARVQLAAALAKRSASVKVCVQAAAKLAEKLAEARGSAPTDAPALDLAERRAKQAFDLPRWDALRQVGAVPPWAVVVEAARQTCTGCSLRPVASQQTCKECPAVELLRRMIETRSDACLKEPRHA